MSNVPGTTRRAKCLNQDFERMFVPTPKVHVTEVFSPPRLTRRAPLHGLNPGLAVDLRIGWDLDTEEGVRALWKHLRLVKP